MARVLFRLSGRATLTTASLWLRDNIVQTRNSASEFVLLLSSSAKRSDLGDMSVCFGCIFSVLFVAAVSRSMLKRLMSYTSAAMGHFVDLRRAAVKSVFVVNNARVDGPRMLDTY